MKPVHIIASSAIGLGLLGLALIFAPQETAGWFGWHVDHELPVALLGSALFGLALLNWMGRNAVYGGIYGRPILLGNAVHAFTGSMTLIRAVDTTTPWPLWGLTAFFVAYALGYGWMLFVRRPI